MNGDDKIDYNDDDGHHGTEVKFTISTRFPLSFGATKGITTTNH